MTSDRYRVDVWIADVTRRPGGADPAWLSQSERAIAARRCAAPDLWLNGRLLLRQILGNTLHVDPAELRFRLGAAGKPELAGTPLHFNLSHCGPFMAVAASRGGPVGIDIEAERLSSGLEVGMRRWVLSDAELSEWTGFPPTERLSALYRLWRRKEAVLKGIGCGFALPPRAYHVGFGEVVGWPPWSEPWRLYELALPPPYGCCLAAIGKDHEVHVEYRLSRAACSDGVPLLRTTKNHHTGCCEVCLPTYLR